MLDLLINDNPIVTHDAGTLMRRLEERDAYETASFPISDMRLTTDALIETPRGEYWLSEDAFRHIVTNWSHVGLQTAEHFDRIGRNDVLVYAVNESLKASNAEGKLIVRKDDEYGQVALSVPSAGYHFVDNREIMDAVMNRIGDSTFRKGVISDRIFEANFIDPISTVEPQVGDLVEVGFKVVNSHNLSRRLSAGGYTHRLWCTNGCFHTDEVLGRSWFHRGGLSQMDLVPEIRTIYNKFREMAPRLADMTKIAIEDKNRVAVHNKLPKVLGKKESDRLVKEDEFLEKAENWYELWNSTTELAHKYKNPATKFEIESLGGWVFSQFLKKVA